ncbi:MAG: hypothetical protein U9N54_08525 [candidate division Zixibacteria bacterium]|nr:hypothetical protein [candidate division Zixibacteria bacterium]
MQRQNVKCAKCGRSAISFNPWYRCTSCGTIWCGGCTSCKGYHSHGNGIMGTWEMLDL